MKVKGRKENTEADGDHEFTLDGKDVSCCMVLICCPEPNQNIKVSYECHKGIFYMFLFSYEI